MRDYAVSVYDIVATAPVAFCAGLMVGFLLSNKYRLIRRNGKSDPPEDTRRDRDD